MNFKFEIESIPPEDRKELLKSLEGGFDEIDPLIERELQQPQVKKVRTSFNPHENFSNDSNHFGHEYEKGVLSGEKMELGKKIQEDPTPPGEPKKINVKETLQEIKKNTYKNPKLEEEFKKQYDFQEQKRIETAKKVQGRLEQQKQKERKHKKKEERARAEVTKKIVNKEQLKRTREKIQEMIDIILEEKLSPYDLSVYLSSLLRETFPYEKNIKKIIIEAIETIPNIKIKEDFIKITNVYLNENKRNEKELRKKTAHIINSYKNIEQENESEELVRYLADIVGYQELINVYNFLIREKKFILEKKREEIIDIFRKNFSEEIKKK